MPKTYSKPFVIYPPVPQPEHNSLSPDVLQFIETCFPSEPYLGNTTICCRGKYMRKIASVGASSLRTYLSEMHISKARDYYITRNPSRNTERTLNAMSSLINIVIDIDCHRKKIDPYSNQESLETIMRALTSDWFLDDTLPEPNFVHFTGRGMQLWWTLTPNVASTCYLAKYEKVNAFFMASIEQTLNAIPEGQMYKLDRAASSNAVGLVRLPGTYNTHTSARHPSELVCLNTQKNDLHRLYENITVSAAKSKPVKHSEYTDVYALSQKRLRMLEELRAFRDAPTGEEMRDKMNFLVYCSARICSSHEDAYQTMVAFNQGFKRPMRENELRSVVSSARRKNSTSIYKFRNKTIIEFLDMNEAELAHLELSDNDDGCCRPKNAARDERRQAKRKKRDKKIIALHMKGFSNRAIAEKLNLDRRTAARVISAYTEEIEKKSAERRAKKAAKAGERAERKANKKSAALETTKTPAHEPQDGLYRPITIAKVNYHTWTQLCRNEDFCGQCTDEHAPLWPENELFVWYIFGRAYMFLYTGMGADGVNDPASTPMGNSA